MAPTTKTALGGALLAWAAACAAPVSPPASSSTIVATYYAYDLDTPTDDGRWELGLLDAARPGNWRPVLHLPDTFEETPDVVATSPWIVFVRSPVEEDWAGREIWKVRRDGTGLTRLTHNRAIDVHPSWSPDGRRIAFMSWRADDNGQDVFGGTDSDLYLMDEEGGDVVRLTASRGEDGDPEFSPDGTRLCFKSTRATGEFKEQIFILDLQTLQVRRLTVNAHSDHDPTWSPDGSEILIERYLGAGAWNEEGSDRTNPESSRWVLVRIDAVDGRETVLTVPDGTSLVWLPTWSPDGRRIAFVDNYVTDRASGESENRIGVMGRDGSDARVLPGSDEVGSFDWWSRPGS
jgi:Tol biopolymer transport system component